MKLRPNDLMWVVALLVGATGAAPRLIQPTSRIGHLPPRLISLASEATHPQAWAALRAYATGAPRGEVRGYAYFTLGYREYRGGEAAPAAVDLAQALEDDFPLRDLATYYLARADYDEGETAQAAKLLRSFQREFPNSTLLAHAMGLLAWADLQSGQPDQAIQALTAYPQTFQRPNLELELALAYKATGDLLAAARIAEDVYYASPAAPQAKVARLTLRALETRLGAQYPRVSDRIQAARAEALFRAGHFGKSLKEYSRLVKEYSGSQELWDWTLGQALCLLRLNEEAQAIRVLRSGVPLSPSLDAERLRLLVEAYMDLNDERDMTHALNQLRIHDSRSNWYAEAIYSTAAYYEDKGNVRLAGVFYLTDAEAFRGTRWGRQAAWRLACLDYAERQAKPARADLIGYIERYPASERVAGALYFLGRLAEDQGEISLARHLYGLVARRYPHDYYALQSAIQRSRLKRVRRAGEKAAQADFSKLAALIPASPSPRWPVCVDPWGEPALRPYLLLASLHLGRLASQCLRELAKESPSQPVLLFALSQIEAERGRPDIGIYLTGQWLGHYQEMSFRELPDPLWTLLYPRAYWLLVKREAPLFGLNPFLVMAVIRQESGFYPEAVSSAHAVGLMQILEPFRSYRARLLSERLENPGYNVRAGCAYLNRLLRRYRGKVSLALAAYNAGPTRVDSWLSIYPFRSREQFIEMIPFPGTRAYVRAVLRDQILYQRLLTGRVAYRACAASDR